MNNKFTDANKAFHYFSFKWITLILIAFFTLLMAASLVWNVFEIRNSTLESARSQARTALEKDILYRRWDSLLGGVYAQVSDKVQPNPYLEGVVSERDITTSSGRELTLINPAYMTRQVHELERKDNNVVGHITSLKPIRPENAADPWERDALLAFEKGAGEVSSIEMINGIEYIRLMQPLLTEEACLKCHEQQGYKKGDIRGGISVSIPMKPFRTASAGHMNMMYIEHLLVWIFGFVILMFLTVWIGRKDTIRRKTESEIIEKTLYLESILTSSTDIAIAAVDLDFRIKYYNPVAEKIFGYKAEDVIGRKVMEMHTKGNVDPFRFEKAIEAVTKEGEYRYIVEQNKEEGARIIESKVSGILDANKELIGFVLMSMDTTERRRTENELREKNKLIEAAIENAPT